MSTAGLAAPDLPAARGADETGFLRQLQQVTTRIHDTDNLDQLMLDVSGDICDLLDADRITLYAVNDERTAIVSKIKVGLNTSKDLKLPISPQSLAGYVAFSRQPLNVADVYDDAALTRVHPHLRFLKEVDRLSGYRTHQMMVLPIVSGQDLLGVLQVINHRAGTPFTAMQFDGAAQLARTLAAAIRHRMERAYDLARRKATRYDGLVASGAISAAQLSTCEQAAKAGGPTVEAALLKLGVAAAQIGLSLARFFGVAYEPAARTRVPLEALHGKLKREFTAQQQWVPLEDGSSGLVVMCLDPEAVRASRIVPQVFDHAHRIDYRVTTQAEFDATLDQLYPGPGGGHVNQMLAELAASEQESAATDDNAALGSIERAAADNELVKFVNKVILDAYQQKASDIHIEPMPGKEKTGIRFRIDGTLMPYAEVPAHHRQAMVTRLKIMCDLDIAERRKPQDGKIQFKKFGGPDIELRVATIPSTGGVEDVVMRILAGGEPIALDQLGLTAHNRERLVACIGKPYGLFYVCGPTGSGKTTTLHSILKYLNTPDTKIWTAEDPVEITQKGLRQVQINKKAGIDFALVMRAFLRADPDVIMVGESRDHETVSMGIEASLTGHLVFSTLHTNSAPESIVRLLDMGMDPFNFADALLGILAQRLAKRLCACKQAHVPTDEELRSFVTEYAQELQRTTAWQRDAAGEADRLLAQWRQTHGQQGRLTMYQAVGCDACNHTGYKGRVGLHELMVASDEVKRLMQERARVASLFAAAVEGGMRTLKMDGMEKVLMGITDMKQVRAVCMK